MAAKKSRTRRPLSAAHATIAEEMFKERTRPRPGLPNGIPISSIPKGIAGPSTIDRIEAGTQPKVNPSTVTDLMLRVYRSDHELILKVAELAEATLDPNWFDAYRPKVAERYWLYQYHEDRASHIWCHSSNYIPTLAQCPEYVDAIFAAVKSQTIDPTSNDPDAAYELRNERIARWAESDRKLTCLIGEATLKLNLGASVMDAQVRHLLKLDALDHVEIYVAPLAAGRYPTIGFEYFMLNVEGSSEPVIYVEGHTSSYVNPDSRAAAFYQEGLREGIAIAQRATEFLNDA